MASLLHLTENRNIQNEFQKKKRNVNEQISIFKSISFIFYVSIAAVALTVIYLMCFVSVPALSGINAETLQNVHEQSELNVKTDKVIQNDNLQALALEIEENENCLLKDPYTPEDKLITSDGKALLVSPPRITYKGYYIDSSTKTAIIEITDSNTQLFLEEKQSFYSGTAVLIKIKKEEIIWRWHGNLYITKIG